METLVAGMLAVWALTWVLDQLINGFYTAITATMGAVELGSTKYEKI